MGLAIFHRFLDFENFYNFLTFQNNTKHYIEYLLHKGGMGSNPNVKFLNFKKIFIEGFPKTLVTAQRPNSLSIFRFDFMDFGLGLWTGTWPWACQYKIFCFNNFVKLFEINISNILIRDFFTMSVIV